jgi:GT2 family glycosyltransferase
MPSHSISFALRSTLGGGNWDSARLGFQTFVVGVSMLSIVIPVRNAAAYAPHAVRSAIRGGGQAAEIVVSDNFSTDGTFEALQSEFGSTPQVRLVRPTTPLSMTSHFNFALALARSCPLVWCNSSP